MSLANATQAHRESLQRQTQVKLFVINKETQLNLRRVFVYILYLVINNKDYLQ